MNFDFNFFKDVLGFRESKGNYSTNTGNGVYGKYQFKESTINNIAKILNEVPPTIDEFLKSPDIQEKYMNALITDSLNYIKNNKLELFADPTVTGASNKITAKTNIYGLVAGAHLGGAPYLKDYLTKGIDRADKYGTHISDYVAKFSRLADEKKKTISDLCYFSNIDCEKMKNCLDAIKYNTNEIEQIINDSKNKKQ